MRGPGPAAGAPVAVATLPSRGLPRPVQFSVAKSVQFSKAKSVQFSTAIDKAGVFRPGSVSPQRERDRERLGNGSYQARTTRLSVGV